MQTSSSSRSRKQFCLLEGGSPLWLTNEEQNDQTENGQDISAHVLREHVQDASPMVTLSLDEEDEEENEEEDGQDRELAMETSTISNATLKLAYDVEYRAPE